MGTYISLYSASITQTGTSTPTVSVAGGKSTVTATWLRITTGSYELSSSGLPNFSNISGSATGSILTYGFYKSGSFTGSVELYRSGSNTGSMFLRTYNDIFSGQLVDQFPGAIKVDIGVYYI
jgi:hypothetical protein